MSTIIVNDVLNDSISQVLAVCPDIDIRSVKLDLTLTGNAEQTINRILDGTNLTASEEDLSLTDINSDSSLELPIIPSRSATQSRQLNSLKLNVENNQAFDSDSETELPDLETDGSTLSSVTLKTAKRSEFALSCSVSNVNENISKLKSPVSARYENNIFAKSESIVKSFSKDDTDLVSLDEKIKMNSEDENYDIVSYPTQNYAKPNTCFSSDSGDDELPDLDQPDPDLPDLDLPDLDLPCLADRFRLKSRPVLSDFDSNASEPLDYDSTTSTVNSERSTVSNMSELSDVLTGSKKGKKKRTPEDIAESKRQAMLKKEEKMREKEEKKAQKEREAQLRKMESENKKAFRPGDCLKKITVSIDPGILNTGGVGGLIFKVCEDLGVKLETLPQSIPNSVLWKREVIECTPDTPSGRVKQIQEEDIIIMIPLSDFISMVTAYSQKQRGDDSAGVTFTEFVQSLQCSFSNHIFTFFVQGLDKYFSDLRLIKKQKHKEAVLETGFDGGKVKKRKMAVNTVITQVELEEAMIETQLITGCIVKYLNTNQQIADLIKTFTKAVAEKPAKKGRLENVFNFLEEGTAGVKVDKNGQGLLKVFKHQLMQFKNLGPDMADAILGVYPSPSLLLQAYNQCNSEKEKEKLLENIMVRRGGGVLATNRRVGKEMSRRIYLFFTTRDPNFVIK